MAITNVQLICFGYLKHVYSFNTGGHPHREITKKLQSVVYSSVLNRLYFARGRRLSRAQKGEIGLGWCQGEASIRDDPQWQRMTRKDHNAAPLWDLGPDV